MPELWETADLMEVTYADAAAPPDGFWMRYFGRTYNSTAREVFFDDIPKRDRRLAAFVAPNVQGRVYKFRGAGMKSFAPAYVKPKHVIDPSKAMSRRRGEPPFGAQPTMSLQDKFDALTAQALRDENDLITRREDWMACHGIVYGQVVVEGEDYPRTVVDFARDPGLTLTPVVGATWDDPDSAPLADLQLLRKRAFDKGNAPVRNVIFGTDAWGAFSEHESTQKLLDNMRRGSESEFNTTGLQDGGPFELMGQISGVNGQGRLNLFTYSNEYEDEDGVMRSFIDSEDVIGVGEAVGGVMAYGAILDRASLQAVPRFPKQWEQEDPSVVYTMTQSAPLPVPTNINNTFRINGAVPKL